MPQMKYSVPPAPQKRPKAIGEVVTVSWRAFKSPQIAEEAKRPNPVVNYLIAAPATDYVFWCLQY